MMNILHSYIPQDRLRALAIGASLPNRTEGAVLFADISGFTQRTEWLTQQLGSRRGAEELTRQVNHVYDALIAEVERYDGSVINFAGDSITCWFDSHESASAGASLRAVFAAWSMQIAMQAFPDLALKIAVASGPARRFLVGDPKVHYLDALAGATVARSSVAEQLAKRGEILIDEATINAVGSYLEISEWRRSEENGDRFAVLAHVQQPVHTSYRPGTPMPDHIPLEILQAWLHRQVYEREISGQGSFLTEFRLCAVMFVRFMGIDYEAEGAQDQLGVFIEQAQHIAAHYEGDVVQLTIGDKGSYFYVNFGALTAHEDDPRRAIKAAMAIREVSALSLQIGICYGVMRVGAYGGSTRRTYGAIGDDVNIAARLMQTAAPDEILVSERVKKMVATNFVFEARALLHLKGKSKPLQAFTVLGQRTIGLQEPIYALPMVGRKAQLQTISDRLGLVRLGKAQAIGIVAEAGMGKSRLVAESIRLARLHGFIGYGGSCQSDGVSTPYLAWKSVWSVFFDPDQSLEMLEARLESLAPHRKDALPLLGVFLNRDIPENNFTRMLEPKYRQSALLALLEDCLRAAARQNPILIVLEDLHWVDALSLDLLENLIRGLADSSVCFILAYRPSHSDRPRMSRLELLPNFIPIHLQELNQEESVQAIQAKIGLLYPEREETLPISLVEKLTGRAQGNPFFLEELLNLLHDRNLDPFNPADFERIELPESLHALILSRIDQLTEGEKNNLRVASIIGRLFYASWLVGYYPELGEISQVKTILEKLHKLDITPLDSPEPELSYLFKHIVIHEVTYESLPFATRARLHERLAKFLEEQIAIGALEEKFLLDVLVYHYTHSENRDQQCVYLRKAGLAALAVSAFGSAVEYFSRLLELIPAESPDYSQVALRLAEAHYNLGDFTEARNVVQKSQDTATTSSARAAALAFLGELVGQSGDYAAAQVILAEAVPLARESNEQHGLCRALWALGLAFWRLGKLDDARAALTESLELARAIGDANRELFALNGLGTVALQQDAAQAEKFFAAVHELAVTVGNRERAMMALNNLGVMAAMKQDYALARKYIFQSLGMAREIGAQQAIAMGLINLAASDIENGQLAEVRPMLREGLSLAQRLGALPWVVAAVTCFADLAYIEDCPEAALSIYGLARLHPAWNSENQRQMEDTLTRWALSPHAVETGLAAGSALDWDTTVADLLAS